MKFKASILVLLAILFLNAGAQEQKPTLLSPGVYDFKLTLDPELEPRREVLRAHIIRAQERICRAAQKYDWTHLLEEPILTDAIVFARKKGYDDYLKASFPEATKDLVIPKGYVAGFNEDTFFAVAPEIYEQAVPKFIEEDSWEKLIAHEFAHRLHTRIVNGQEEKMGPIWFWEGFATFVSGQFENRTLALEPGQLRAILKENKRGDYRVYNAVLKHYVKLVPLPELVRRAAQDNFEDWLMENANP